MKKVAQDAIVDCKGEAASMRYAIQAIVFNALLLMHAMAWGTHPLITDDTNTQGAKKFQFELNGQYESDKETVAGVYRDSVGAAAVTTLSYGFREDADLVLSLPYQWSKAKQDGITVWDEKGISDTTLEVKWRFFDKDGLSLALRPGVTFPTGNNAKGFGTGKTGYRLFILGSKEAEPWAFHVNAGYIDNENKVDEEKHLWHASLATTYQVIKNLKLVGNVGIEHNPDGTANNDPAFLIGGVIYSLSESFDIDCGVKHGLSKAEADWSLMAGMALRF